MAQIHGNSDDSDGDSEEDLDLGIDKLKANKGAASAKPSEPEKTDVSPLTEEKERHKKNLM